jgi:hypothetical protein
MKISEVEEVCALVKAWNKKSPLPEKDLQDFESFLKA